LFVPFFFSPPPPSPAPGSPPMPTCGFSRPQQGESCGPSFFILPQVPPRTPQTSNPQNFPRIINDLVTPFLVLFFSNLFVPTLAGQRHRCLTCWFWVVRWDCVHEIRDSTLPPGPLKRSVEIPQLFRTLKLSFLFPRP